MTEKDLPMAGDNEESSETTPAKRMTGRARTIDEVVSERTMTEDERVSLEDRTFQAADPKTAQRGVNVDELDVEVIDHETAPDEDDPIGIKAANPPNDPNAMPDWVIVPNSPRFKFPPYKQVAFMLFRAGLTDRPDKGDRQVILWGLSDAEEKLAGKRTRGETSRVVSEMSKQLIRACDGHVADWTGKIGPGNVERFWDEIGPRYRVMIQNFWLKTHALSREEQADFFMNCLVVRTAAVG